MGTKVRSGGERRERGAHFLHGLDFDLADSLGRDVKFVGQVVQRGGIVAKPACLDDPVS